MGYLYRSICYDTKAAADAVWFSNNLQPVRFTDGVADYVANLVYSSSTVSYSVNFTVLLKDSTSYYGFKWATPYFNKTVYAPQVYPDCTSTNATDGLALGWGIAAAMAIAWGAVHVRRMVR